MMPVRIAERSFSRVAVGSSPTAGFLGPLRLDFACCAWSASAANLRKREK